jgi:hypothetical protein
MLSCARWNADIRVGASEVCVNCLDRRDVGALRAHALLEDGRRERYRQMQLQRNAVLTLNGGGPICSAVSGTPN